MYSLFIDTSYKYLSLAIAKNKELIASYSEECFKRQSEQIFVELDNLFKKANIKKKDIESVYITEGPGSYTGVRIGMSLAKVLCEIRKIKLYKISTLKLYANNGTNTMVVMDARANRAYVGIYNEGAAIQEDKAIPLNEIDAKDYVVMLDGSLIGQVDVIPNIPDCFINCMEQFEEVKDINHLAPKYLKESDAYYR